MKKCKIFFVGNGFEEFVNSHKFHSPQLAVRYFMNSVLRLETEKWDFEFVLEPEYPEYLIVGEGIYYNSRDRDDFIRFYNKGVISIFVPGEFIAPDLNIFDYAVAFDRNLTMGDRIVRMPTLERYKERIFCDYTDIEQQKNQFCNFIYSNPVAHKTRDELFFEISKYKKVDSLGKHLNNMDNETTRDDVDWDRKSIVERLPYKFSIACENALSKGYISEKILMCFQAKTIPIYWGDMSISEEFNSKAFINCHDFKNYDELRARIQEIDEQDEIWNEMISQPWQTEKQRAFSEKESRRYEMFWKNIFTQDISSAKRVGIGTAPSIYFDWFAQKREDVTELRRSRKLSCNYCMMKLWLALAAKNISLENILQKENYKEVAIYGLGEIGKLLYDDLEKSEVTVKYVIDQGDVFYKDAKIVQPVGLLESVDAIIVTIVDEYKIIKEKLSMLGGCNIVSLKNLLESVHELKSEGKENE